MRFTIIILIIFLLVSFGESYSEEINNIGIIDSLILINIQQNFDALTSETEDSLAVDVSELEREKSNYLKVLIGNLASENSFKVFRNYNPTSSFQGLVLTINQFTSKVGYSKPYTKSFLGKDYVARRFDIELRGQLYSARTNEILKAIDLEIEYADEIPYAIITEIEDPNYSFSKGKREDYTFWEKIYEPILVIASVGVVVYLFFTQRT
jgi:hypothetical protein